jgi:hypothetical protein
MIVMGEEGEVTARMEVRSGSPMKVSTQGDTISLATFRRKNGVSEAALVRCGRNGVVFAVQFRHAEVDQRN